MPMRDKITKFNIHFLELFGMVYYNMLYFLYICIIKPAGIWYDMKVYLVYKMYLQIKNPK